MSDFRFKTPAIPDFIKAIRHDGYKNIFEFDDGVFPKSQEKNLWGTETLCGDWDGKLLIILKDFAPTGHFEDRHDVRPRYSHTIDSQTNGNLVNFLSNANHALDKSGIKNTSCGILYISACFLLKCGNRLRTKISASALEKSWPVIKFTIANMPNLKDIALCGTHAFKSFERFGGAFREKRSEPLYRKEPIKWSPGEKPYNLHVTCHPTNVAVNSFGRDANQEKWNTIVDSAFGNR